MLVNSPYQEFYQNIIVEGYLSMRLTPAESNYSNIDRDALAIRLTTRHAHHVLRSTNTLNKSDYPSLEFIFCEHEVSRNGKKTGAKREKKVHRHLKCSLSVFQEVW